MGVAHKLAVHMIDEHSKNPVATHVPLWKFTQNKITHRAHSENDGTLGRPVSENAKTDQAWQY